MDSIGKRIRFARKKNNLTLTDIKKITGLSTGNLSELENDKFMPSANALIALRNILNVSIDWILTGEDYMQEQEAVDDNMRGDFLIKETKTTAYSLNQDEQALIDDYRKLDAEKQRDIKGFIRISLEKLHAANFIENHATDTKEES
ncbi:helix-turn-helix transcriptional regulator [Clostridiaceae bacterium 35-E11]